jgi:hypothetical protein
LQQLPLVECSDSSSLFATKCLEMSEGDMLVVKALVDVLTFQNDDLASKMVLTFFKEFKQGLAED